MPSYPNDWTANPLMQAYGANGNSTFGGGGQYPPDIYGFGGGQPLGVPKPVAVGDGANSGGSGDGFFNVPPAAGGNNGPPAQQPNGNVVIQVGPGQQPQPPAPPPPLTAAQRYKQMQNYNANPPGYDQWYDPTGGMGYSGAGNLNYTGQDPYQLAALSSGMSSYSNIAASRNAADASMYGSHQGLLGTQDTNAAQKAIAAGNNTTALGLGGMQENVGLTSAADQLAAARAAADASQGVAKTQAGASMYGADQGLAGTKAQVGGAEQVAQTQVGPDYAKLALQGSLLDKLFGGASGTGSGLTAPGGIGGGALGGGGGTSVGGTPGGTSTGTSGVGTLSSVPTPATPQFNPMLTEQSNARSNSIIQRNLQTQKNALADQYGQSGSLASGAGYNQDVGMLNNAAVQNEVSAENQNNQNALQFNSQNALPYAANAQNFLTTEQQLQLEQQRNQIAAQNPLYGLLGTVLQ